MIKLALATSILVGFLTACIETEVVIVANPTETPNVIAITPLELIDISKMPLLGPKRTQSSTGDALG